MSVDAWHREGGFVIGEMRWGDAPDVTFELRIAGAGQLVEFCARSETGVTARRLREAPVGTMQRVLRQHVSSVAGVLAHSHVPVVVAMRADGAATALPDPQDAADPIAGDWHATRRRMRKLAGDFAARPRPGGSGRGPREYAALAQMYVTLLDKGDQFPVKTLAADLHLSPKTIRNLLFTARERGLLTSAGQGKAGGSLTAEAVELLRKENEHGDT